MPSIFAFLFLCMLWAFLAWFLLLPTPVLCQIIGYTFAYLIFSFNLLLFRKGQRVSQVQHERDRVLGADDLEASPYVSATKRKLRSGSGVFKRSMISRKQPHYLVMIVPGYIAGLVVLWHLFGQIGPKKTLVLFWPLYVVTEMFCFHWLGLPTSSVRGRNKIRKAMR